jgi:alpha-glucosidase
MDSSQSSFRFVRVDEFTPNSSSGWASFGPVTACNPDATGLIFTLTGTSPGQGSPAPVLKITILGPSAFRLRFNPAGDYTQDGSFAVVQPNLGAVTPQVVQNDATKLSVDLGGIRLDVLFSQLMMQVYRGGQLINADAGQGIVYIPRTTGPLGGKAVANFKVTPSGANYFGFGEKGGRKLRMNGTNLTFFNYDNFKYAGGAFDPQNDPFGVIPQGECSGPLNESEPLYNSIPFLIEDNPSPAGGRALCVRHLSRQRVPVVFQPRSDLGHAGAILLRRALRRARLLLHGGRRRRLRHRPVHHSYGSTGAGPHVGARLPPGLLRLLQP